MILIAWFLSVYGSFFIGYELDKLRRRLSEAEDLVRAYRERKKAPPGAGVEKPEESPSQIIDPDDLVQQIRLEHDQKMKLLNPDKDDYVS